MMSAGCPRHRRSVASPVSVASETVTDLAALHATADLVFLAMGTPSRIWTAETPQGEKEIWVYQDYYVACDWLTAFPTEIDGLPGPPSTGGRALTGDVPFARTLLVCFQDQRVTDISFADGIASPALSQTVRP